MERALADVRIADFTQMAQGPWASQLLADVGADVVKVEPPGGEWERRLGAGGELHRGTSPYFLAMNRNKRSLAVDLKSEEGRAVALDVVSEADVVVENFSPGTMERLGLGYEDVTSVNPGVVYVSGSGFGRSGPDADRPGQDLLVQAKSGFAARNGRGSDPPTPAGVSMIDAFSGMLLALHTLVALRHRRRTGEGQRVSSNLLNAAVELQRQEFTAELNLGRSFARSDAGIGHPMAAAPYGIYEAADGHVAIAMGDLEALASVLDAPALAVEELDAFEDRDELKRAIESHTREWEADVLLGALLDAGLWAGEVNDTDDALADEQVTHNDLVVDVSSEAYGTFRTIGFPVTLSETPGTVRRPPPTPGEHSAEILGELGYDESLVDDLVAADVVSSGDRPSRTD